VIGCADPTWMTADVHVRYHHLDKLIVACNYSDDTFVFTCYQRRWFGEIGNCTPPKTTGTTVTIVFFFRLLKQSTKRNCTCRTAIAESTRYNSPYLHTIA